uniref:ComEC/Rec2 family competence protein n=1 Tax=Enterocloster aldenensis TaxID=358742 RepID=UPI001F45B315|nr:ComEC/Rec2 family competence protein [uncultured Lachnoclostridium sp.]
MKRPLIVLAAGFVLGEVLALQGQKAVSQGLWWWLYAAAGLFGMWSYRMLFPQSGGKRQGSSAGKTALLLFFVLALTGGCAGYARGAWEKERLDREEVSARGFTGTRVTLQGRIGKTEQGNGSLSLVLEDVKARVGKADKRYGRVIVYVKDDEGGKYGRSGADDGGGKHGRSGADDGGGNDGKGGADDGGGRNGANGRKKGNAGLPDLLPGMTVEIKGKMEAIEGPGNPGEFDFRRYYRSKGTACRMFGEQIKIIDGEYIPYQTFLMKFRAGCGKILDRVCPAQDSAVFKAVLLGDTSGMEPEVRSMYQRHGISHLLAVSGQHLAIIGGGIYLIMRRLGLGYSRAGILGAVMVISYGIMTGSSGSAIRAVIMIMCLWLAASRGRSYDTLSALGLAAVILLWKAPYLLYASGFQLSFGAVFAIGGLGGWLKSGFKTDKGWKNTILMSLCVQIVITPVVLYHYYQHPLYGIFMNLLVIPLIAVLMYSGILGIVLGSFWLKGGTAAVGAGHYVLCFYEWLCRQVEHLPGYCLVMGRPSWIQIILYGAGMAGTLYWLRRLRFEEMGDGLEDEGEDGVKGGVKSGVKDGVKSDGKDGVKGGMKGGVKDGVKGGVKAGIKDTINDSNSGKGIGGICRYHLSRFPIAVTACLYGLLFLTLLPVPEKGLKVIMLDVGQGDGIVMRTEAFTILVDGGSSSDKNLGEKTLEPCLKSMGIDTIDFAVVSHGDSDHISGLLYLMEHSEDIAVRNLILPMPGRGQEIYDELEQAAEDSGGKVFYMAPTDRIQAGGLNLTCLYAGGGLLPSDDRNAHSLVLCADYKGFHMLFTGDMGTEQEKGLLKLAEEEGSLQQEHLSHVQVLKMAHHGSDTSSGEGFLDFLDPDLALVSYGRGNSYGHPSPDVMERMKKRRIPVMETGYGGAVILRTDGKGLRCVYFMEEGR